MQGENERTMPISSPRMQPLSLRKWPHSHFNPTIWCGFKKPAAYLFSAGPGLPSARSSWMGPSWPLCTRLAGRHVPSNGAGDAAAAAGEADDDEEEEDDDEDEDEEVAAAGARRTGGADNAPFNSNSSS